MRGVASFLVAGRFWAATSMPQTLPIDENEPPPSKMAEADAREALRQKLAERDRARAALVEVVQEEDQRIAQLREKRAQDREMRRKEHEAATQPPPAQPRSRAGAANPFLMWRTLDGKKRSARRRRKQKRRRRRTQGRGTPGALEGAGRVRRFSEGTS